MSSHTVQTNPLINTARTDELSGVSIVVPAYDEQEGIKVVLERLTIVMNASKLCYEIIVVDDGSKDKTFEIANRIPGIRVIRHKNNRGYGAALKSGIRHADYNLICITDADGTYPNEQIPELVRGVAHNNYDMLVGARVGDDVNIPTLRRPAKMIINTLAQAVVAEKIPDLNSGLRVFKRTDALRFFNILPDGYSFTTTITLGMLTNGYLIDYLPINYHSRKGRSKIRPVQDTLNFIQLVARIALYFAPLKIFLPLSGFLFLLGFLWVLVSGLFLGQIADASAAVIMMSALQIAVVGMLADLINRRFPSYTKPDNDYKL